MTTGSVTIGSENSPVYYRRIWNGTDGLTYGVYGIKRYYRFRKTSSGETIDRIKKYVVGNQTRFKLVRDRKPPTYVGEWVYKVVHHRARITQVDHPYTVNYRRSSNHKGTNPVYGNWISLSDAWITPPAWTNNDEIAVLAKLATKIRGHSFNLGVALGEGRESVRLVHSTLSRFLGAIIELKKGRIDLALRRLGAAPRENHKRNFWGKGSTLRPANSRPLKLEDVSGMWLEIQYGWRPLIQDVFESVKAYSALADRTRTMKFSASHNGFVEDVTFDANPGSYFVHRTRKQSVRYIYTMTESVSAYRSLGLYNPAAVSWELIPFSFVADWFIPIGNYLDVLCAFPSFNGRYVKVIRETNVATGQGYGSSLSFAGAYYNASQTVVTRSVGTTLSVPLPTFISARNALSPDRVKNAIALLHQQLVKF